MFYLHLNQLYTDFLLIAFIHFKIVFIYLANYHLIHYIFYHYYLYFNTKYHFS